MPDGRWQSRLAAGLLAPAALALALVTGCTSDDTAAEPATPGEGDGLPVIAPGKPGEQARTLSPEAAREAADDASAEPSPVDVAYLSMMIQHHRQALVMTGLAEAHATDPAVRRLAERISIAQEPEIEAMEAWLEANAGAVNGNHAHEGHPDGGHDDPSGMPGLATEEQLDRLRTARGGDFDALFLDLMIAHHEGAVTMATEEAAEGSDGLVIEMANHLVATQGAEIDRMENLR